MVNGGANDRAGRGVTAIELDLLPVEQPATTKRMSIE
jgi:hypothetical protein